MVKRSRGKAQDKDNSSANPNERVWPPCLLLQSAAKQAHRPLAIGISFVCSCISRPSTEADARALFFAGNGCYILGVSMISTI